MFPPAPVGASPVDKDIEPDESILESPEVIETDPLTPPNAAPAVVISTFPDAHVELAPDDIWTSPPVPIALPLFIVTDPPEATALAPAFNKIFPATPAAATPDEIVIDPVDPLEPTPVYRDAEPLEPPLAVNNSIEPETEPVDPPLVTLIDPPVEVDEAPLVKSKGPP